MAMLFQVISVSGRLNIIKGLIAPGITELGNANPRHVICYFRAILILNKL